MKVEPCLSPLGIPHGTSHSGSEESRKTGGSLKITLSLSRQEKHLTDVLFLKGSFLNSKEITK